MAYKFEQVSRRCFQLLREYGMAWLSADIFVCARLPSLTPEAYAKHGIAANVLQQPFPRDHGLEHALLQQSRFDAKLNAMKARAFGTSGTDADEP